MRRIERDQEGQSIVLIALMLVGLVSFLGLIFDVSNAYAERRWMQNSADAGSLAGARVLAARTNNSATTEQQIWTAVQTYANANGTPNTITAVFLNPSGNQLGVPMPGNGGVPGPANCTSGSTCATGVRVTSTKTFATFFLRVVNANNGGVNAVAAVQTGPAGAPIRGLLPIGVPRCYVDPSDVNPALCGSNASTTSHPILGNDQTLKDVSGSSSWRGILNLRVRQNSDGDQTGCEDGGKTDAQDYINAGGYNDQAECGNVDYNEGVDVLTGSSNGAGGPQDYQNHPELYSPGMKIIVCVYPEGTIGNGTKEYVTCIGFAQMTITYVDGNDLIAVWSGTYYQSGPIDTDGNPNFGGRALQLSQ